MLVDWDEMVPLEPPQVYEYEPPIFTPSFNFATGLSVNSPSADTSRLAPT